MGKYLVNDSVVVAGDDTDRVGVIVYPCYGTTISVQRKWAVPMTVRCCVTPGSCVSEDECESSR